MFMDKDSIIERQKIDCNCNDCKFMIRCMSNREKWDHLHLESPNHSARLNYGHCIVFNKVVSFIPNVCQIETQQCFQHRKS